MKRCHENSYSSFPADVYGVIREYLPPKSKAALNQTGSILYELSSLLTKSLCFLTPENTSESTETEYEDLLRRYPHITKLTFESCNEAQIRHLINFFNINAENHPLSRVKELVIHELKISDPAHHKVMHHYFLGALSHSQLESFTWVPTKNSQLTYQEIQLILNRAINLKRFEFLGGVYNSPSISFQKQAQLASVIFKGGHVDAKTLASLRQCQTLETLCMTGLSSLAVSRDPWKLKRLVASANMNIHFTKSMPSLTFLTLHHLNPSMVTYEGELSKNCPALKELRIDCRFITKEQLARLIQGLANLEVFIFKGLLNSPAVAEIIEKNCPKLNSSNILPNVQCFYSSLNEYPKPLLESEDLK